MPGERIEWVLSKLHDWFGLGDKKYLPEGRYFGVFMLMTLIDR